MRFMLCPLLHTLQRRRLPLVFSTFLSEFWRSHSQQHVEFQTVLEVGSFCFLSSMLDSSTHTHTRWIVGGNLSFFFPPFLVSRPSRRNLQHICVCFISFSLLVWIDLRMHHRENTPLETFEDPERAALQSGQWWGCHVPNTHGSSITFKCINTNAAGKLVLK
jgi:hypothetical protein